MIEKNVICKVKGEKIDNSFPGGNFHPESFFCCKTLQKSNGIALDKIEKYSIITSFFEGNEFYGKKFITICNKLFANVQQDFVLQNRPVAVK